MYSTWPDHLPRDVEAWALQPPGRENRLHEPAFDDLATLVRDALADVESLLDGRPFAIVGHSMGALIGFELTRELRRRGLQQPDCLYVSGHAAPHAGISGPIRHALPDAMFVSAIHDLNPALTGNEDYRDAIRFMLPTLRADFTLCERYRYVDDEPLACNLTVWGGLEDPETTLTQLVAWREQTTATFSLRMFPGDHFFLATQRRTVLRALTDGLEPSLDRARRLRRFAEPDPPFCIPSVG